MTPHGYALVPSVRIDPERIHVKPLAGDAYDYRIVLGDMIVWVTADMLDRLMLEGSAAQQERAATPQASPSSTDPPPPPHQGRLPMSRYTVHTVETTPCGTFAPYSEGGPALVTVGAWCVSFQTGGGEPGAVLSAFVPTGPRGSVKHPLHGTRYGSVADAQEAAYQAGLLGYMVYEEVGR